MSTQTRLDGITSPPLSGYLAALGVLRAVATQLDPSVTGWWDTDTFVLDGIDRASLVDFLDQRWSPTPVFSPWNKEGDPALTASTKKNIDAILGADDARLDCYRAVIGRFESLRDTSGWESMDKPSRLAFWRANVPDAGLAWLDAAFVLGAGDAPSFPPLLLSGGNDGRFEFSRTLHREIDRIFVNPKASKDRCGWLRSLLFDEPGPALVNESIGLYDGSASGTPNSSPSGSGPAATNPWAIVLAFEGLLALAGSTSSRLGASRARSVSAPFMVRISATGDTSTDLEDSKGELWAPLWERPTSWPEIRRFLGEGRLDWSGSQARNSVDAGRAVGSLGAERGVAAFDRYAISQRNGLSYVASPNGRVAARRVSGIDLLQAIDGWVGRARRFAGRSSGIDAAVRRLDRSIDNVVASNGTARSYANVLTSLAALERSVANSTAARTDVSPFPMSHRGEPVLPAGSWARVLLNTSDVAAQNEVTAALGLASLRDLVATAKHAERLPVVEDGEQRSDTAGAASSQAEAGSPTNNVYWSMAAALRGLHQTGNRLDWAESSDHRFVDALAAQRAGDYITLEVLKRRLRKAAAASPDTANDHRAAFSTGRWVPLHIVAGIMNGSVRFDTVLTLARAFALLGGWSSLTRAMVDPMQDHAPAATPAAAVSPWFAAVRLCLCNEHDETKLRGLVRPDTGVPFIPPGPDRSWGNLLGAGRFTAIGDEASTKLRRAGLVPPRHLVPPTDAAPGALAAALLLELGNNDIRQLAQSYSAKRPSSTTPLGREDQ